MSTDDPLELRALAEKCRMLAKGVSTAQTASSLRRMADDYERQAGICEADEPLAPPTPANSVPNA